MTSSRSQCFWSFTCVEMALWEKFNELNPGPFVLEKKGQQVTVALNQFAGKPSIQMADRGNATIQWQLSLPRELGDQPKAWYRMTATLDTIVRLRNSFAHEFSHIWSPPMAVDVF